MLFRKRTSCEWRFWVCYLVPCNWKGEFRWVGNSYCTDQTRMEVFHWNCMWFWLPQTNSRVSLYWLSTYFSSGLLRMILNWCCWSSWLIYTFPKWNWFWSSFDCFNCKFPKWTFELLYSQDKSMKKVPFEGLRRVNSVYKTPNHYRWTICATGKDNCKN